MTTSASSADTARWRSARPPTLPWRPAGGTETPRSAAFTLPELLLVMLVITLLLGLLLAAIRRVHQHTLETVARAEVKGIEGAWQQYFAHYQTWPCWPTNNVPTADTSYVIDPKVARALQGAEQTGDYGINPDNVPFLSFSRFSVIGGVAEYPVNPWGEGGRNGTNACYFAAFDFDGDGRIVGPDGASHIHSVLVWTVNPDAAGTDRRILGSW